MSTCPSTQAHSENESSWDKSVENLDRTSTQPARPSPRPSSGFQTWYTKNALVFFSIDFFF